MFGYEIIPPSSVLLGINCGEVLLNLLIDITFFEAFGKFQPLNLKSFVLWSVVSRIGMWQWACIAADALNKRTAGQNMQNID